MSAVTNWISNYLPWVRRRRPVRRPTVRRWPSPEHSSSEAVLSVQSIDLCLAENSKDHHTERFDLAQKTLVVRRGQSFKIRITLNRPFVRNKDAISFIFTVHDDDKPSPGHGTLVAIAPREYSDYLGDPLDWGARISGIDGIILTVLIKTSSACPVTQWKLDIDTKLLDGPAKSFSLPQNIFVLYNAWCRDDQVYMADPEKREEYILQDTTLIWRGSYNRLRPSVWKLGQFEKDVLECSMLIVAKPGKVPPSYRGDPIRSTRALSAAVNSVDDDGVVFGNWTEDFADGTAPTKWVGSVEILQKYFKKQKPVKYGQCWIFAGVLTTAARALGIPSRIVTNYSSAHDTQASLTVDYFVDENGKVLEEMNTDSIWNYHVWNEVWMERPDLGVGEYGTYDGWQAVDATPQEASDSLFRCGPASVLAVKLGEIMRPYDCNFLYSEVNADKVFWKYTGPYQPMKLLRKDTLGIGHLISTKAIGEWRREDITSTYKFAEKTDEERNTMIKALRQARSAFSRYYLNENFNEIYFDFELKDDIKIGEEFTVVLLVENRSDSNNYLVMGALAVDTIHYTGQNREKVKMINFEVDLHPGVTEYVRMEVTFHEYFPKLVPQAAFNISCLAAVKGTDYEYYAQDDFRVRKPDIKMAFQGKPVSQEEIDVVVRLTNPLPIPLRKGVFQIEGPGIEKPLLFKIAETGVGGTAKCTFKYTPPYAGRHALAAKFYCKELDDVDGFLPFEAEPRPEDVIYTNGNALTTNEIISRNDIIP